MDRAELRQLFKRHRGSISRIAEQAGVTCQSVSEWLKGWRESDRIERAAIREAKPLLKIEVRNRAQYEALAALQETA